MPNNHTLNEKRTLWVVLLTFITMLAEIFFGLITNSMALLADGIHMGSHVLAIGLSWLAYVWVRRIKQQNNEVYNTQKILSLSGYTSGLLLLVFAGFIIIEAAQRFYNPLVIDFNDAIVVAIIGLMVNLVSALILHHHEHENDHSHTHKYNPKHEHQTDHNLKAAYLHVLADALTSVAAIIGLLSAKFFNVTWVDSLVALLSSALIIKWSVGLLMKSGKSLVSSEEM